MCVSVSIELQVQEQPVEVRSAVYSHLEAFVPCNKEALLKRLKKLSLNIQVWSRFHFRGPGSEPPSRVSRLQLSEQILYHEGGSGSVLC